MIQITENAAKQIRKMLAVKNRGESGFALG